MMAESEGDKWRKWFMELVKILVPAVLAWQTTAHFKQQQIDKTQGALDTANGVVYEGQSPAYYEGFHEQIQKNLEEKEETP